LGGYYQKRAGVGKKIAWPGSPGDIIEGRGKRRGVSVGGGGKINGGNAFEKRKKQGRYSPWFWAKKKNRTQRGTTDLGGWDGEGKRFLHEEPRKVKETEAEKDSNFRKKVFETSLNWKHRTDAGPGGETKIKTRRNRAVSEEPRSGTPGNSYQTGKDKNGKIANLSRFSPE